MPYDPALDAETFKETKGFKDSRITVGVFSYNGGEKKLQIARENLNPEGEWRFAKLGRLNKLEAKEIIPLLAKALDNM